MISVVENELAKIAKSEEREAEKRERLHAVAVKLAEAAQKIEQEKLLKKKEHDAWVAKVRSEELARQEAEKELELIERKIKKRQNKHHLEMVCLFRRTEIVLLAPASFSGDRVLTYPLSKDRTIKVRASHSGQFTDIGWKVLSGCVL